MSHHTASPGGTRSGPRLRAMQTRLQNGQCCSRLGGHTDASPFQCHHWPQTPACFWPAVQLERTSCVCSCRRDRECWYNGTTSAWSGNDLAMYHLKQPSQVEHDAVPQHTMGRWNGLYNHASAPPFAVANRARVAWFVASPRELGNPRGTSPRRNCLQHVLVPGQSRQELARRWCWGGWAKRAGEIAPALSPQTKTMGLGLGAQVDARQTRVCAATGPGPRGTTQG